MSHETAGAAPESPPVFIRQQEAARRLSVSLRQFRRLVVSGRLSVYKPSRRLALVEWAEVERMVRGCKEMVGKAAS
jgi:excisionase family DNA binding protein